MSVRLSYMCRRWYSLKKVGIHIYIITNKNNQDAIIANENGGKTQSHPGKNLRSRLGSFAQACMPVLTSFELADIYISIVYFFSIINIIYAQCSVGYFYKMAVILKF